MEKIKNILTGNKQDDPTRDHSTESSALQSGTQKTPGVVPEAPGSQGLTGEGSHLSGHRQSVNADTSTNQDAQSRNPGVSTAHPTTAGNRIQGSASTSANYASSTTNPPLGSGHVTSNAINSTFDDTGHSGPHRTEAANRLDPAINVSSTLGVEDSHHHSKNHGGGSEEADRHHSNLASSAATAQAHPGLVGGDHREQEQERAINNDNTTRSANPTHPQNSHSATVLGPRADPNVDGNQRHMSDQNTQELEAKVENREQKRAEKEAEREHKQELKDEKHEHKESKGGFLSFLHRDKHKKYSKEEEAEFDRQEREHNSRADSNAIPLHQKPKGTDIGDKLHGVDRDRGVIGPTGFPHSEPASSDRQEHEHNSHTHTDSHATPLYQKPKGTDLGDKLHGVERNRGVVGPTGFPHSEPASSAFETTSTEKHYSRDSTTGGGSAVLSERQHGKHEHDTIKGQEARNFPTIDHTSGQTPEYSSTTYDSSSTGFQTEAKSERSKLQKDPPAGHGTTN